MPELLNLDDLIEIERFVTIRDQRYRVVDRSVGVLLEAIEMHKKSSVSNEEQFLEGMVRTICQILPDCPENVVKSLSLRQMSAVLEYANSDPKAMAEKAQATGLSETVETPEGAKPGES